MWGISFIIYTLKTIINKSYCFVKFFLLNHKQHKTWHALYGIPHEKFKHSNIINVEQGNWTRKERSFIVLIRTAVRQRTFGWFNQFLNCQALCQFQSPIFDIWKNGQRLTLKSLFIPPTRHRKLVLLFLPWSKDIIHFVFYGYI